MDSLNNLPPDSDIAGLDDIGMFSLYTRAHLNNVRLSIDRKQLTQLTLHHFVQDILCEMYRTLDVNLASVARYR